MKKNSFLLSAIAAMVVLSGCAGTNFKRPETGALQVGKSSYTDVVRVMGVPPRTGEALKNNQKIKLSTYVYAEGTGGGAYPGVVPARAMTFSTFNDLLVGQEFVSSFPSDPTDFDDSKIASIMKGKTTRAEVLSTLGKPNGEVVYPLIKNQADNGVVFSYTHAKGNAFNMKFYSKVLIVSFGADNIVSDVEYVSNGEK